MICVSACGMWRLLFLASRGDRLVKADGRWACCEQEVCMEDSLQAKLLGSPELAMEQERRLVLEPGAKGSRRLRALDVLLMAL